MTTRQWWQNALFALVMTGGLAATACGPAEEGEAEAVAAAESAATAAPSLPPETAKLLRFWALDRYFLDESFGVFLHPEFKTSLLAKAKPDECFNGVGMTSGKPDANGECEKGQPKVNDAYVWGLTRAGDQIFFGTIANTLCLVESGYLGIEDPITTSEWVCEFGQRKPAGDLRAPNLFRFDLGTRKLVSANPDVTKGLMHINAEILRNYTVGLRSAANLDGIVFLAGPSACPEPGTPGRPALCSPDAKDGISMFALDAATGDLLGAGVVNDALNRYTNVRMWRVVNGALYVGLGTQSGGSILRWTGDRDDLFQFVEVGKLPSDAANMTLHDDGRLYITTWPSANSPAGLFRSPVIPAAGLTAADVNDDDWSTPLWLATDYDPDAVCARSVGGGAIASYRGRLYFGTMSVPMVAAQRAMALHPESDFAQTMLGTHRSIAVFEVKFANHKPKVSMLYGEKFLPTYDAATNGYTIRYDRAHKTGFAPRWGPSGFGNFFNAYTWSMEIYQNQLFVGTFDWSQVARTIGEAATDDANAKLVVNLLIKALQGLGREGADLIRMDQGGAVAESIAGCGNDRNYGIRNMITDGKVLYLGTANPMNLDPKGGWELLQLKR